jgi:hypothetical protein
MLRRWLGGSAALLIAVAAACNDDPNDPNLETDFAATLTGTAERPTPVTTTATGSASIEIDDDAQEFEVTVTVNNLVSITMAHIHVGDANTAGPIAVTLVANPLAPGSFSGTLVNDEVFTAADVEGGETFATLAAKIRAGTAYINVHTVANQAGELRGQLAAQ